MGNLAWRRGGRQLTLTNGPRAVAFRREQRVHVPVAGPVALTSFDWRRDGGAVVVEARYQGVLRRVTWRVGSDGDGVRLDYEYAYDGAVDLLGVSFDLPDASMRSKRWLGRGPYRVYRNRLEGGLLDLHEVAYNDPVPGQSATYPEFKGYFGDWRWLQIETPEGLVTVENRSGIPYFGLGGPRDGQPPMMAFPETGLAFLDVIPAQGSKFDLPDELGPQSQTPRGLGVRRGGLTLRFAPR